jgi:hypothetical protein
VDDLGLSPLKPDYALELGERVVICASGITYGHMGTVVRKRKNGLIDVSVGGSSVKCAITDLSLPPKQGYTGPANTSKVSHLSCYFNFLKFTMMLLSTVRAWQRGCPLGPDIHVAAAESGSVEVMAYLQAEGVLADARKLTYMLNCTGAHNQLEAAQ